MSLNKDTVELLVGVAGCAVGLGGAVAAIHARWKASIEKGYAAQRDFAHLKRNQENMTQNLGQILKEQDDRFDRIDLSLNRVESMLHNVLARKHGGNGET